MSDQPRGLNFAQKVRAAQHRTLAALRILVYSLHPLEEEAPSPDSAEGGRRIRADTLVRECVATYIGCIKLIPGFQFYALFILQT